MSPIMQETAAPSTIITTSQARLEFSQEYSFSQKYSKGELEEMDSRELLDGYAE